jgi:pimeloyl-ACP methyl ester carboxylesterase
MRPALATVRCPTVVISGAEDGVAPPELQEELADGIRGAHLERIEDCGHLAPLEQPHRVASLLDDWLTAPVSESAGEAASPAC